MEKKKNWWTFVTGVLIGYGLVQGFAYVQTHYLWVLFYQG